MEMAGYLAQQVARQSEAAIEDSLVMRLRNAVVDGAELTDLEIVMFFGLLTFAGNDTTRNTAATGLLTLLEHPEALAALYADPTLIPTAVEEILRWTSVVQWFARTATRDVELDGKRISEGDKVVMWYGSGSVTSASSRTRTSSTSTAPSLSTSRTAAVDGTSAWARAWLGWNCGSSSRRCWAG